MAENEPPGAAVPAFEYESFVNEELNPALLAVKGPIDSFPLAKEVKTYWRTQAIETGSIAGATFFECPAFDDENAKRTRFEAKRALELSKILAERETDRKAAGEGSGLSPADTMTTLYAEKMVLEAQVVEASRRHSLAVRNVELPGGRKHDDPEFTGHMLREGLRQLYKEPDPRYANQCLGLLQDRLSIVGDQTDPKVHAFIADMYQEFPFMAEPTEERPPQLDPAKREELGGLLHEWFGPHFQVLRDEFGEINNDKIVDVTNRLLVLLGYATIDEQGRQSGYTCKKPDENDSTAGFKNLPDELVLLSGTRKKEITWDAYEVLMVHEVGKHVTSTINAYRVGNQPLQIGLPGSSDAEESTAKLFEEAWTGKSASLLDRDHYRYLIGAYAFGTFDGQKHTADETFRFATWIKAAADLTKKDGELRDDDIMEVVRQSRETNFEHVFRFFRGGELLLKDLGYYGGKIAVIETINNSELPMSELLEICNRGKLDISDQKQVEFSETVYANAA